MKTETTLAYLMQLLDVSGKELAVEADTDTTTVSKWRTGKRRLAAESGACRAVAAFFLSSRFAVRGAELNSFMEGLVSGFSDMDAGKRLEAMCYVLSRPRLMGASAAGEGLTGYQSTVQVFSGDFEGWKNSSARFWQTAAGRPRDIILCDFGDIDWNSARPEYLQITSRSVMEAAASGSRVCIIDVLGDSYRSYDVLMRWMDMYMTVGVDMRCISASFTDAEKGCYYLIRDSLALVGYSFEGRPELLTYTHFSDHRMLSYYQARVMDYVSRSRPLFFKLHLAQHMETVRLMAQNLNAFDPTYMICPAPTYINMPPELLQEVLESNSVAETQIDLCLETLHKRHEIRQRCKYIQIYDMDAMEERLLAPRCEAPMLSRIMGRPIYMTGDQYRRQLEYIAEILERGEMEIDLVSFRELGVDEKSASIVAQSGHLVIIWDDRRYDHLIYSTEPTYVGGFVTNLERLYEKLPPINKNMDWVRHRLREYTQRV